MRLCFGITWQGLTFVRGETNTDGTMTLYYSDGTNKTVTLKDNSMCKCKFYNFEEMIAVGYVAEKLLTCGHIKWGDPPVFKENPNLVPPAGGFNVPPEHDPVKHPTHYTSDAKCGTCGESIECIEVARVHSFTRGNAIKYLWRAGAKGDTVEDLKKAIWYIEDEIAQLEGRPNPNVHRLLPNAMTTVEQEIIKDEFERSVGHPVGMVTSSKVTDKGLEVDYALYSCSFDDGTWLKEEKVYRFVCATHDETKIMPICKAPTSCLKYRGLTHGY